MGTSDHLRLFNNGISDIKTHKRDQDQMTMMTNHIVPVCRIERMIGMTVVRGRASSLVILIEIKETTKSRQEMMGVKGPVRALPPGRC